MRGDNKAVLVKFNIDEDGIGNQDETDVKETPVFCDEKSVTRSEFWAAGTNDVTPEIVLVVRPYEFNGETRVDYNGVRYRIIRSYKTGPEDMELICGRGIGDGEEAEL